MIAYIIYDKLWRSKFYNNVSPKDRWQDIILNQLKLKVNGTYEKDEKLTTNFEHSNGVDVVNIAHLNATLSKTKGQFSFIEKNYNEFQLHNKKHSVGDVLIERAVRTTNEIL